MTLKLMDRNIQKKKRREREFLLKKLVRPKACHYALFYAFETLMWKMKNEFCGEYIK